jgi:ATP-dependent Zn protease
MTPKNPDRYGAAIHEAGHAVVAWALGLKVRRMAVGINGDDSAGSAEIEVNPCLPLVDRIAVCSAGIDAQSIFDAPTNDICAIMDMNEIRNLVEEYPDDDGEALRYAGYRRSKELLELHRAKVERLAQSLVERTELDQVAIEQILISNG